MQKIKVRNMESPRSGRAVANQFIIETDDGVYFQSYNTTIVYKNYDGRVFLDEDSWDYSVTTGKYRNEFLGCNKKETQQKIDAGIYQLARLN